MFNFINHNSFKIYFIISILIVNLSILFLNKNKFFYYYEKEINFFAFESDISKFNQHQFTILNYITEQLGNEYKFRNFRIVGPNFTKIHLGIKKYKNEKKTDYIRSNHLLSFTISSSDQKTINDVTNSIMISYPTIMEYLNSIDFLNYFNLTKERIQIICYNILTKKIEEYKPVMK